jgi:hypothetical protein
MSRAPARLSEDARLELSMAAAARERRNRPRGLVFGAVALLVIAAVAAGMGVKAQRRAVRSLRHALEDQAQVEAMAAEFRALSEQERTAGTQRAGEPLPNFRTLMETLATQAGLSTRPALNELAADRPGSVVVRSWSCDFQEASIKAVLDWLRRATVDPATRIPGLEVYSLDLKPAGEKWQVTLRLRRWERAS